jgi:hypothetical protein
LQLFGEVLPDENRLTGETRAEYLGYDLFTSFRWFHFEEFENDETARRNAGAECIGLNLLLTATCPFIF